MLCSCPVDLVPIPCAPRWLTEARPQVARTFWQLSRDNTIKLWDARGGCLATLVGHDSWVEALVFHPVGKYLLSVSDDKKLKCWDLSQQGRCVKTIDAHDGFVTCLNWAPGIAKNVDGGSSSGEENKVDIRCDVATGGWDWKVKIFTG